ncbi:MAG: DUF58 domain-containing protein [Hyphomicrobiales bacterium]
MDSRHRLEQCRETTAAAGYLLTAPGLAFLSAVFVLAEWYSQTGIMLLAGLFLSTAGLARLWNRLSLAGVRAQRLLNGMRFFPGEPIGCTLQLFNRKPLPLPWVQLENDLPAGLCLENASGRTEAKSIRRSASLLWYRGITWKLKLIGGRRGYYPLSPLKLASGDFIGLYSRSRRVGGTEHIAIYPCIFPVDTRLIPTLYPMGEARTARRLFRDPTHAIGVREHVHGDDLKSIHWKATARRGDLQVKVPDATASYNVAIVLAVESFQTNDVLAEVDFELAISTAGSIAAALCGHGNPVGLLVNTRLADTGQPAVIAPGAGRSRIIEILDALAKVTSRSSSPATAFLESQKAKLMAGTTVIFILGRLPDGFPEQLAGLRAAGFKLLVLIVGGRVDPSLPPDLPWRRIRHPSDLAGGSPP